MKRKAAVFFMMGMIACAAPARADAGEMVLPPVLAAGQTQREEQAAAFYQMNDPAYIHSEVQKTVEEKTVTLYTLANVNFREHPDTGSEIMEVLPFNTAFEGYRFSENWYVGEYDGKRGFIHADYASEEPVGSSEEEAPENSLKSFMSYKAITSKSSPQYKLQREYSYTGNYGIRQVKGRYCAALGSAYTTEVGQYFDLILENGTCIPCILADQKANEDTDSSHRVTYDGSLAEFVVDTDAISGSVWHSGDVGSSCAEWDSPIRTVRLYDKNVFEE